MDSIIARWEADDEGSGMRRFGGECSNSKASTALSSAKLQSDRITAQDCVCRRMLSKRGEASVFFQTISMPTVKLRGCTSTHDPGRAAQELNRVC